MLQKCTVSSGISIVCVCVCVCVCEFMGVCMCSCVCVCVYECVYEPAQPPPPTLTLPPPSQLSQLALCRYFWQMTLLTGQTHVTFNRAFHRPYVMTSTI